MKQLNPNRVLAALRKRLRQTQVTAAFGESLNNNKKIDQLLTSLESVHSLIDKLQPPQSRRGGPRAKVSQKVLNKFYWIIRNTIASVIDTQQRFNKNLLELLRQKNDADLKLRKKVKKLESKVDKSKLYNILDYHGFENENRGNEESLLEQQKLYIDYFRGKSYVLDVGCGRGEFLTLLRNEGIGAKGIEVSRDFVDYCQGKGLNVEYGEVVEYLKQQPNESIDGLIALQVVEHLDPAYLARFVKLAFKKMSKDSYIVLETINPQSLIVFAASYHNDLTHIQPIHPAALQFMCKTAGFQDCNVVYSAPVPEKDLLVKLPEDPQNAIFNDNVDKLNHLLYGPQNYAIVGKKI